MKFDASLRDRWSRSGDDWCFEMPAGWMQGRGVFGGLTVASAAALALRHVDPSRPLRAISTQFARPVAAGEVNASVRVVREGRTATFAETIVRQHGRDAALVAMVFATPHTAATPIAASTHWKGPDPDSLEEFRYVPGVFPEFTQNVAYRWASGGVPFSAAEHARFTGYCRFRAPAGDVEGVIGLLDAWPCPSLSVLKAPVFASTVTWTAHILRVPDAFDGWFPFAYETVVGAGGFHTAVGRLYDPDGALIGWSEQLVAVFE